MLKLLTLVVMAALPNLLPMVFLTPDDLLDAQGVRLEAQLPQQGMLLAAKDANRPQLWHMPVAARSTERGATIWYQRVDKGEADYLDQRTLCIGEIEDGVWRIPELAPQAPAWGGTNNVCMRRSPHKPTWGGFNVFQMVEEDGWLRMLYWDQPGAEGLSGAILAKSRDGRQWQRDSEGTVFTEHNDAFSLLKKGDEYLLYQTMLEDWPDKPYSDNLDKFRRVQSLRTSRDLRTWTSQTVLLRPDAEDKEETEFYLMKVFPYGQGYLGLIMKYFGDPARPGKHSGILTYELVVSKDALTWERPFRDTDLGFWSYADPFRLNGDLHFAIHKDGGMETVWYRGHRMVAVVADGEGVFTSGAFAWPPTGLVLDADTREGWIEAELVDAAGAPLEGCRPVRVEGVDATGAPLAWENAPTAGQAQDKCRLRFHMHNAKLFAVAVR
ncbi:MAG: hypothetical protein GWP08_06865 [Nitrospiraceae bacterium]|nr:hypothetical protein [Nitrospiraceae bacterium]